MGKITQNLPQLALWQAELPKVMWALETGKVPEPPEDNDGSRKAPNGVITKRCGL